MKLSVVGAETIFFWVSKQMKKKKGSIPFKLNTFFLLLKELIYSSIISFKKAITKIQQKHDEKK